MNKSENDEKEFIDNMKVMKKSGPGDRSAMAVVFHRLQESQKPEGERICYDPYAIYFADPSILEWLANNPEKAKAMQEQGERLFPGLQNSNVARVRFFDDFVISSLDKGLKQLVILGAGYDTRAYRIKGLEKIKTFEVDRLETQADKIEKIRKIFGSLPSHVVYVPADLAIDDFGRRLLEVGYDRSLKTLFLMEGLLMYLMPEMVDKILSFIVKNSCKGSSILFDYYLQSATDETYERGKRLMKALGDNAGVKLQFLIKEGEAETFLKARGFSQIHNVTSEDNKKAYFQGINESRTVSRLMSFAHAVIE